MYSLNRVPVRFLVLHWMQGYLDINEIRMVSLAMSSGYVFLYSQHPPCVSPCLRCLEASIAHSPVPSFLFRACRDAPLSAAK